MSRNSHDPFDTNSINNEAAPSAPKMSSLRVLRNGMVSTLSSTLPPTVYAIRNYFQESSLGQQVGYGFILMTPALITASPWAFAQRASRGNFFKDTLGGQIGNSVLSSALLPLLFMSALAVLLRNVAGMTYDQVNDILTPLVFFASIAVAVVIGAGVGAGFYGLDHRREIGRSCRSRNRGENTPLVHGEIVGNEIVANSEQAPLPSDSSLRQKMTSLFACCTRRPSQVDEQNSDIEASGTPQNYQSTPGNV